ncbi:exocyst complex component Sec10-like protein [Parachaetomium inaequale]|uniref:Exocyst complex component Sec10-like protein n=1 Tax=Parachaetomium inaequale TaxID=2588326 RepID=A0AAN6SWE7_9PEZI|nr:exocyst complex component Sec10-like protein [Parachaetomium inaequale]
MSLASRRAAAAAGGPAAPKPNSILQTLQAAEMIDSKPVLPAEILSAILDYLPVADQVRVARASRRMREMVYDDTRWVARLRSMGCWDEAGARRRFEEVMMRRRAASGAGKGTAAGTGAGAGGTAAGGVNRQSLLFDVGVEEEKRRKALEKQEQQQQQQQQQQVAEVTDGFETMKVAGTAHTAQQDPSTDPEALLQVIKNARSVRGLARQEYGKIYGALAPFYFDLVRAKTHTDPLVFKVFRDPERQAQMLANLRTFARSDWAQGAQKREEKVATMTSIFESAVLREFEQGYEFWDVDGRMNKYAHVLALLNGSSAAIELFIQKHPVFTDREVLANSMDCVNQALADSITLEPSRRFFEVLTRKVNEQAGIIERIFPNPGQVFWAFVDKVREDVVMEYATPLFDETHERSIPSYLRAVSGIFEQTLQFLRTLTPPKGAEAQQEATARELALKAFEPHLDLYLQDEIDEFTRQAEHEVGEWEKKLSEQEASAESFYMAGFTNRQADKKDFLTSFKKVVMMPVTVLPTTLTTFSLPGLPLGSPFATKPSAAASTNGSNTMQSLSQLPSRSQSPAPPVQPAVDRSSSPMPGKAPTDELAAKAALMTSRLEGIKSLFSIEVALSLVHSAKASLGRVAVFIQLGGQAGGEAREQCEAIFVALLRILSGKHVKPGFDRAVAHLSQYNPREVSEHDQGGVAPLVTFIELVNVGDLISQMIDVFYEQQLAGPKIADRNDFLDPAGLAKKKFEQMLDESVAAGLNKGIDVLMDEVEYICATTQLPTDYNPGAATSPDPTSSTLSFEKRASTIPGTVTDMDIGPTRTAQRIRDLVASHTSMLVGSTDKSMLDVFNGEVGLRLFAAVCKHLKRQRVSTEGAIKLIADMNLYFEYVRTLKNQDLLAYFKALRELSQIYLIDARHAKEMATIIADGDRFGGIFRAEEVYEYAERRADWYQVRKDVERAMYGLECCLM